jgi:hypothetical protein
MLAKGVFNGSLTPMVTTRDTRNTTVDSNGFIKVASPVVKIYGDGDMKLTTNQKGYCHSSGCRPISD